MLEIIQVTVEKNDQGKVVSKVVVIHQEISKPKEIIGIGFCQSAHRYSKVHIRCIYFRLIYVF